MNEPITQAEWFAQGVQLFGEDILKWRFRCPACKHVASGADYKAAGAQPDAMGRECIGRYTLPRKTPDEPKDFIAKQQANGGPCDWAAYGLFGICPVHVKMDDGKVLAAFEFAPEIDETRNPGVQAAETPTA